MIRPLVGNALRRLLAAAGLIRVAELERARRAIRSAERDRADQAATVASAKLEAVSEKFRAARERASDEHAKQRTALGLLRYYLLRLARIEEEVAGRVALDRRVKRAQVAIAVRAARRHGLPPAAAAEAARFAATAPEYGTAVLRWQSNDVPADLRRITIAGLQWAVPADAIPTNLPGPRTIETWLPMDDLATIRQFAVGGLMLDIGAGVGATSIPRVLLGDFLRAYAAEPDGLNYLSLVGNMLANGVEGRVLPDRVAVSGSPGSVSVRRPGEGHIEEVPTLTADAWVQRLGISSDEVRFVRVVMQEWNRNIFHGAANLLKRRHVVWQVECRPSLLRTAGAVDDLSGRIGAHFTHIKDLGRYWAERWRPAAEAGDVLRVLSDERAAINILLFNLPDAHERERSLHETRHEAEAGGRPVISLLHATARLPDGWKPAMEAFLARAKDPAHVEYILAVDEHESFSLSEYAMASWGGHALVREGVSSPVSGYNAAARAARGDILMQIADDYFPPEEWDEQIRAAVPDVTRDVVLDVDNSDGVARLLPFSILTRTYYEKYGYIFYPRYHGFFADNDFTEQARRDRVIRKARHIVFEHRHPDRGTAPMDEVYARQKSHFAEGKRLFKERKAKGFPKWPA